MAVKNQFNLKRYPELLVIVDEGAGERGSLADEVHDAILLRIIRGELPGGVELKSTQLAAELKVSRTPVNVALARLEADGIVTQPVNRRATVRHGADNWLVDIHRMRQLVEPEAVRAAAGNIPDAVVGDLELLMREALPAADGVDDEAWITAARYFDYALHLVGAEFCGNLSMRETIRRCWSYKRLSYDVGDDSAGALSAGYSEHASIFEALREGKGAAAARLMREHLRSAELLKPGARIL